ncbi:MAG TPA: UxaA family hydrolase [Candidatus Kapabacteria bacterium]|nr:UxaA family hydrolase [Candidatus Kapabacteria bacterium]
MAVVAPEVIDFADAGRVPAVGDNVAIAIRNLPAGTRLLIRQLVFEFSHTVLEGHRFVIFRIRKGEPLLSWGLPFGLALRDIEPGEYLCNEKILRSLKERHVDFVLPAAPNFIDHRQPFSLEEASFIPGLQAQSSLPPATFQGYPRNERRGVGTRNYIVVIGTTSRTAGFARNLCRRFRNVRKNFPNVDGVVPVDHTEGGGSQRSNNFELTLRTLAGFVVNPNVGAVLCVDYPSELLSNTALKEFLAAHQYPVAGLIHDFLSIGDSYDDALERAAEIISGWIPQVNSCVRAEAPVEQLCIGLQCGGSDAFSGVSANPLLGIMSRETVAQGGKANLAETDELIGAESYVLSNVRDVKTAREFLAQVDRFQSWAALHGHSAEGNPSGGNMYRGLYNISIKSIGAARKKDPAVRLDHVIDFAQRMEPPGFYFMNSPGNDLESIAGQVAAGCNMILFATGNGSITNFPFVPTIKVMTTTRRFELLRNEMDFNAGRYLDGESLEELGHEAFRLMQDIASGKASAGERAGHSQVQLWREWRNNTSTVPEEREEPTPATPQQIELAREICVMDDLRRVALVLPTSLCSGQIAAGIVQQLNVNPRGFDCAVALPHTEGCGNSGGESERLFMRTMAGYLAHPFVSRALLLEHGCEKTHNDAFRHVLSELGLSASDYAFRSVQLDGGIQQVTQKSLEWFSRNHGQPPRGVARSFFAIGFHGQRMPANLRTAWNQIAAAFLAHGAAVVRTFGAGERLSYGERLHTAGLFRMDSPTDDDLECVTGLGASGVELIVTYSPDLVVPGNPLIPTMRIGHSNEVDLLIQPEAPAKEIATELLQFILELRKGNKSLVAERNQDIGFQITRGTEGISL